MGTVGMPASGADPFDAGPYARLQAARGRRRPWVERAVSRAVVLALVAWLPLLFLAAVQGLAMGESTRDSFLLDPSAYARYVLALPVLVLAEQIYLPPLARIAEHFVRAGVTPLADRPRYQALIDSSRRLIESPRSEITLLLVAYLAMLASAMGRRRKHRGRRPLRAGLLGHHRPLLGGALLPLVPLLLTVVPFDEIVQFTSKLVL